MESREDLSTAPDDSFLKNGVKFGLAKLITYFQRLVLDPDPSYYCIATVLHPRLRLAWFKDHWSQYDAWHKKAEKSVRKVFKSYLDTKRKVDELMLPSPSRRKLPGGNNYHLRWARTISVNPMLLTGSKSHKRHKRMSQLDEYFDSLQEDLDLPSDAF